MAYHIENRFYLCRTLRDTKLYRYPNDIQATSSVLPSGIVFQTNHMITIGTVTLLQISSVESNHDLLIGSPVGLWISRSMVDFTPIENMDDEIEKTQSDDSSACDEQIVINGKNPLIYETSQSVTAIGGMLELEDLILVDRKVNFNNNGVIETRYHIKSVTRNGKTIAEDLTGMWIAANYSVTINDKVKTFSAAAVLRATAEKPMKFGRLDGAAVTANGIGADRSRIGNSTTSSTTETVVGTDTDNSENEVVNSIVDAGTGEVITLIDSIADAATSWYDAYKNYGLDYVSSDTSTMSIPLGRLVFVHGMPFQYTHITDRRVNSTERWGAASEYNTPSGMKSASSDFYGRTFSKEIASNMPVVVVVPGIPQFMTNVKSGLIGYTGVSSKNRNNWLPLFSDLTDAEATSVLDDMMNDNKANSQYQYYSMLIDTTDYFEYVNALCQTSARLMGLDSCTYMGKACTSIDWGSYNSAADQDYTMFQEVTGLDGGVSFAFDPLSSISDSITNTTTASEFSSLLNQISSKSRELEFISGTAGAQLNAIDSSQYEEATQDYKSGAFANVVSRMKTFITNSAHGMNVRFPQIWSDSASSKSFDLDMKFITPYNTAFCKWRYVLVPFFHWFALAAPHSDDQIINYSRPFLIRAFSKGYFNVEMGLVESLQWKRFGDGDMISSDGIPTQIDVSVTFQDLYQQLAISRTTGDTLETASMKRISVFFNNTGLMDMLGTLSGVNMNRISIAERISLYASTATGAFSRSGSNFLRKVSDRTRQITESYLVGL